jgi:hypothetical protein
MVEQRTPSARAGSIRPETNPSHKKKGAEGMAILGTMKLLSINKVSDCLSAPLDIPRSDDQCILNPGASAFPACCGA